MPDAVVLAAINKRIANILKKTHVSADWAVEPAALSEEAERRVASRTDPVARSCNQGDPSSAGMRTVCKPWSACGHR